MKDARKILEEKGVHFPFLVGLVKMGDFFSFRKTLEEHIGPGEIHDLYQSIDEDEVKKLEEIFSTFKGKLDEAGYY